MYSGSFAWRTLSGSLRSPAPPKGGAFCALHCRTRHDLEWPPLRSGHVQRKDYFKFSHLSRSAERDRCFFHRRGRSRELHLQCLRGCCPNSPSRLRRQPPLRWGLWHGGKASGSTAKCPAAPEAPSQRELSNPQGLTEGVNPGPFRLSRKVCGRTKSSPFGGAGTP